MQINKLSSATMAAAAALLFTSGISTVTYAADATVLIPEVNNRAAAAAIVALDSLLICISYSSLVFRRSGIAAPLKDPANGVIITQLSKLMSATDGRADK